MTRFWPSFPSSEQIASRCVLYMGVGRVQPGYRFVSFVRALVARWDSNSQHGGRLSILLLPLPSFTFSIWWRGVFLAVPYEIDVKPK